MSLPRRPVDQLRALLQRLLVQPDPGSHGAREATYSLAADGTRLPTLICDCGEAFREDTWEQAGSYLDEHIREESGKELG